MFWDFRNNIERIFPIEKNNFNNTAWMRNPSSDFLCFKRVFLCDCKIENVSYLCEEEKGQLFDLVNNIVLKSVCYGGKKKKKIIQTFTADQLTSVNKLFQHCTT